MPPAPIVPLVLLAAGSSSRMGGRDKLLEEVDGEPLLRLMAGRCIKAGPTRVMLPPASDPRHAARRAALDGLEVEALEVPGTDGMAASLRAGIAGLDTDGVMFVLADMPEIRANDLHLLISLWARDVAPILRAGTEDGRPGLPVIFDRRYFPAILRLKGDRGANSIIEAHKNAVAVIPLAGDRALVDLDTEADWKAWRASRGA